ncbi:MAG: tyrosine-type recombinase/integrase [Eubacteriales bacterium]|nr:tyrosine-type recombinase/integrase [Eubacteriales bacterium]
MKSFDEFKNEFLHVCEFTRRLDSKTLRAYKIDLLQFQAYLQSDNLSFLEKDSIGNYLETLHQKYAPASVKRKIATLKAFYHYLERKEYADNPFRKIDVSFREPQKLPRYVPLHIIQELINIVCQEQITAKSEFHKNQALKDLAIIELLFSTGIRISELCCLPADCIDLQAGEIKIYGKGAKERLLQLDSAVVKALGKYQHVFQAQINREGYFFTSTRGGHLTDQSVRYMINKYTRKASGNTHITPHMFRHTFAKSLLEQDVDIRIIQPILGHSSIKTTERYTYVSSNKQKEVLQNKNPLSLLTVNAPE